MVVDLRSVDPGELAKLAGRVRTLVHQRPGPGLTSEIDVLGERPAGGRPRNDPLVALAAEGLRWLGYEPAYGEASTDMNIPISLDIPAVCIGTAGGERGHTIHEHVRIAPFEDGLAHVTRMLVDATAWVAAGRPGLNSKR
jgi:acetylornithine deacetylase/succinyl-diaminopimelate desuccinylase-like protein